MYFHRSVDVGSVRRATPPKAGEHAGTTMPEMRYGRTGARNGDGCGTKQMDHASGRQRNSTWWSPRKKTWRGGCPPSRSGHVNCCSSPVRMGDEAHHRSAQAIAIHSVVNLQDRTAMIRPLGFTPCARPWCSKRSPPCPGPSPMGLNGPCHDGLFRRVGSGLFDGLYLLHRLLTGIQLLVIGELQEEGDRHDRPHGCRGL